jgi:hypothetical protein
MEPGDYRMRHLSGKGLGWEVGLRGGTRIQWNVGINAAALSTRKTDFPYRYDQAKSKSFRVGWKGGMEVQLSRMIGVGGGIVVDDLSINNGWWAAHLQLGLRLQFEDRDGPPR